ncbi:MAG: hypothetical protein II919_09650 [Lachnospiraceae bacterium]|nr:hypothetical protein [Lachnospiraceae bacterium]
MKKRIIRICFVTVMLFILGLSYTIFFSKYSVINSDTDEIKCIKIQSFNKRQEYILTDRKDINIVMEYLFTLQYRKPNIYEIIKKKINVKIAPKTGYKIYLYSNAECRDSQLVKEIRVGRTAAIFIDGKEYKLKLSSGEEAPYSNLYRILHEKIDLN